MQLDLENKVFLVAGSSQGIGLGIAQIFLEEGATVVITGRNEGRLQEAKKNLSNYIDQTMFLQTDMQNLESIQKVLKKTHDKWKRIDGVIANIGSGREPADWQNNPDIWKESYDKNVKASMFLAQSSIPYLKQRGGNIIFISSIAGCEHIDAPIAYSMHKAAIFAASKKLAHELASYKIRVNVVAPGNIFFEGGGWHKKLHQNKEKTESYIQKEVPLQGLGAIQDIGNACAFLASSKAQFITGSALVVDGGQTRSF